MGAGASKPQQVSKSNLSGNQNEPLESPVARSHPRHGPDNKRPPTKASGSKAHPPKAYGNTANSPKASGSTSHQSTSGKTSKLLSSREQPAEPSPSSSPELPESPSPSEESTHEQQSEDEENQQMEIPQEALADVLQCNICFETLVQPRTLPCQHSYCHTCLAKYIRINYRHILLFKRRKAILCPVCKTPGAVPNPDRDPDGKDWAEQFKPGLAIQQLLDARVPVSQGRKEVNRSTPIINSPKASLPLHKACQEGELDVVKKIISEGKADINSRDMAVGGHTPVMRAAMYGQKAVCSYLIKQGCDLSAVSEQGNNLLHFACIGGDLNTVKTLIKKKIFYINIMNTLNQTPISYAAAGGHVDVFTYLTNMGCDVTGVDVYNNNILHAACEGGNVEMFKHILSLNVVDKESRGDNGRTPLLRTAGYGHLTLFNFLVSKGCDMRAVDEDGDNILHRACICGNVEMVKHIMSLNVVDKESTGHFDKTPLLTAAVHGHLELLKVLFATGCNITARDEMKHTVLHCACAIGEVDMVTHLMSIPAVRDMIHLKNSEGETPADIAQEEGHHDIVALLNEYLQDTPYDILFE